MQIPLINGQFERDDAIHLITKMIDIKIQFHENKISLTMSEEEIKYRESKIIFLKQTQFDLRKGILSLCDKIKVQAIVEID